MTKYKNLINKEKSGFTLVETLFAVFILTVVIVGLMTVVSNSLFAARYARDEITANYLLQEVIDYVRNDRDSNVFINSNNPNGWNDFIAKYSDCSDPTTGCHFDVLDNLKNNLTTVNECTYNANGNGCPFIYYDKDATNSAFYVNYEETDPRINGLFKTKFKRKVVISNPHLDELIVSVTVSWKNGGLDKERVLTTSITKWQ